MKFFVVLRLLLQGVLGPTGTIGALGVPGQQVTENESHALNSNVFLPLFP